WLNALLLPRLHVVANDSAILRLGVHDIGVGWIDCGIKTVSANRYVPVTAGNSLFVTRLARAGPAVVVLKSAVHVVERQPVIEIYCVVLRDRKIADEIHR